MTSSSFLTRAALCAAFSASLFLGACATGPETANDEARAEVVAEPVTGSNIPRRDRKSVSNVIVTGPGSVKDALNNPSVTTPK